MTSKRQAEGDGQPDPQDRSTPMGKWNRSAAEMERFKERSSAIPVTGGDSSPRQWQELSFRAKKAGIQGHAGNGVELARVRAIRAAGSSFSHRGRSGDPVPTLSPRLWQRSSV